MAVVIYRDEDGYEVVVRVDGDNIINAHILGVGATRDAAVSAAVADLEAMLEILQAPPGVAREVDVRRPRPRRARQQETPPAAAPGT